MTTDYIPCPDCKDGACMNCDGHGYFESVARPPYSLNTRVCRACGGSRVCATCGGSHEITIQIDESEIDPTDFYGCAA